MSEKEMKKAAGAIRLDLAQYREMEVFTQFASDLDDATRNQLIYGQGLMRLLRQPQYNPLQHHQKVVLLVTALAHLLQDVPLDQMSDMKMALLEHFDTAHFDLCQRINDTQQLSDEDKAEIIRISKDFIQRAMK